MADPADQQEVVGQGGELGADPFELLVRELRNDRHGRFPKERDRFSHSAMVGTNAPIHESG